MFSEKQCFRLWLSYHGGLFSGFQEQKNARTVAGELKQALGKILSEDIKFNAAGRTDAGVHAQAQAVSLEVYTRLKPRSLTLALSHHLPNDMSVWRIDPMPLGFDARRHCIGRRYVYRIHQGLVPNPFTRHFTWHVTTPLDIELMNEAGSYLLGEQDFSSFRNIHCTATHARRYLWKISVTRKDLEVHIDVRGNAFCLNMVRIIVGTLVLVGKGKIPPIKVAEILAQKDRTKAGATARPEGLTFMAAYYKDDLTSADIPLTAKFPRYPV